MKTITLSSLILTILISCSSEENKTKDQNSVEKKTVKNFYSNGNVKSISEVTNDNTLNGLTVMYDSLGKKAEEQLYLNGKLNGITKSFFEGGQLAQETEFLNDSIVLVKEYGADSILLFQAPIEVKDIGAIQVEIANNSRNYFLKNKKDTIKLFAKNLPLTNQIISVKNANIQGIGPFKYILSPLNKSHSVKIIFQLKKEKGFGMPTIPIDSTEIEIK